jgi:hypothetical protein
MAVHVIYAHSEELEHALIAAQKVGELATVPTAATPANGSKQARSHLATLPFVLFCLLHIIVQLLLLPRIALCLCRCRLPQELVQVEQQPRQRVGGSAGVWRAAATPAAARCTAAGRAIVQLP